MSDTKSNTDHLHEEGVINKADLTEEHIKSIDSLSKEEIEHLKSISKKVKNQSGQPVGIGL
ncbi:MAG: hypothetical protein KC469_13500 [Flavobacteriaceae bacterium]|jgi:hypothetical protein|nr:hypothetical protein [Flavobacteriaceae bacterium]